MIGSHPSAPQGREGNPGPASAHRVAAAVKAGAVGINCWSPLDANLPWGGLKTSGIGREGGFSGALAYTEEKVITVLMPS